MRKIQVTGVLFLVLALAMSACAPRTTPVTAPTPTPTPKAAPSPAPAPQPSAWDAVVAAAKKEGTVTVYTTLGDLFGGALKAGLSQYGIKVETIGGGGGEIELKIATEQRAKASVADLFSGGFTNQLNVVKAGNSQPVTAALPSLAEKNVWKFDPGKYDQTKAAYVVSTSLTPSVIANTDLVKQGDITSWQDLLDPKWKDQMVLTDPRQGSGPGATALGLWSTLTPEDFWKKLATQRVLLQVRYDSVVSQVVYGDKAIGLFPAYANTISAIKAGAPLKIVHLKEGTSYYLSGIVFVKNAPHPNAAMVLLNWMFSKEGQTALSKGLDNYSVRQDLTETWLRVPELNLGTFKLVEPANNLDADAGKKGADFGKKIFGAQ